MKSFFKKMAIMLICVSIFLSYMPWNVVFATDEIAETPQNVITEETQGSGEATNPEEGNTQLENPKSNAEITEELQGEPSQTNEESSVGRIVKNVKEKVQNVLNSGQTPARTPKNPEDYFIFNESTNTITGYSSSPDAPKDIKIPAKINGVNVEHIGNNAFSGQQLTGLSFELPSSLKSIGSNAFYNNTTLKGDVKIPNGVASIGGYAFYNCGSLTSITIPEGVTSIGGYAFYSCGSLTSMTIPEGVTSIGGYAFYNCGSLTSITIPEEVTSIGDHAFSYCGSLTSIAIPEGVTSIENDAFYACQSLTSIAIPEGVTSIGHDAFYACQSLTSIAIPKSVTRIGGAAFSRCSSLRSITIPKGVTEIYGSTFSDCSSLRSITIPETVTSIWDTAFYRCSSLTSITIPESVVSIGENVFNSCYSLTKINIPTKTRGEISGEPWGANNAIVYWKDTKVVDDYIVDITKGEIVKYIGTKVNLTVPSSFNIDGKECKINSIFDSAFFGNKNIKNVNIQQGITSIGSFAFDGCSSLTSISIPEGMTRIGDFAFNDCESLTEVTIPKGVTSIGDQAFTGCSSIASITIPESVVSIGNLTFQNCSSLRSITLSEGLKSIGDQAFRSCSSLTSITIPESMTSIGYEAFIYCYSLKKINIPTKTRGEISGEPWDADNAIVYWKDTKIVDDFVVDITKGEIVKYIGTKVDLTVPSSFNIDGKECKINSIFESAFFRNKNIKNVNIQQGITSIGKAAFNSCSSLTSITIPESVTSIGDFAFGGCTSLRSITIPGAVTEIRWGTFSGCKSLTSITMPESITRINTSAFQNCSLLAGITIPESVKCIDMSAFQNCSSLASITIPESVTSILSNAFGGCTSLRKINIPKGTDIIPNDAFKDSGIETIYVDQNRSDSRIVGNQPWGASNTTKVFYKGEFVSIDMTSEKVKGEYARNIKIEAYIDKQKLVSKIVMPDGKVINVGNPTWTGEFKATKNGTYVFKGYDDSGNESEKVVTIDDIGKPIVSAENATIDYEPKKISKAELYKLLNASAIDELDVDVPVTVTDADLEKVKKIKNGETVEVTVKATHPKFNLSDSKKVSVTLNLPNIIPGSQNKPEGYVTVTFAKGDHGKLEGELSQHVNPTKVTDLKTLAPKVTADTGFKHTGWDKALKAKFDKDTTVTATYEVLPDTVPGSQEKPAGYVTVTFAKGDHGKLEGETSQHVNPTKVTDLKTLVPKVKADIGFKHIGWDKELKAKFDKDTTITATYEALPDTVPGSQEKPAGYITVTFAKGEHGSLSGELSQHVNPTKVTDLKTLVPKVKADIGFKHTGWDKALKAKFDKDTTITATYEALPDTVPGSQEKPEGYVTVTFAKGEHGSLSGETSQHVNPTKVVDLKTLAPKVTADTGFKHIGWDKALKAKFDKDTTITATYEALPDTVPGSKEKPAGYVTVTFAKGEHGSLSGETSQHVNPTKVTDLKTLVPKVKADIGFKHIGWDKELKAKFEKDTTITATYEALPYTVPGSQEKPAGYVTVTFAKGEHGKLDGELSQHVNPTKITDLKTLAPKVTADTGFKHTGWDKALKAKFDKDTTVTATYEVLPDTVPGSQEKPAGYVTVTFAKGDHGKLEGETSQHVNPTKVTDLKTLVPKVKADVGFKHTGWNSELKKKFTEDTTITATYKALPDTVPGSQEKPAGYITVTFAKGEHGSLSGEMSQHVNPTKITDLKTLAPKVTADTGFKHIGWDKALKAKFDKDTTITATYEALPDTVPGSQEKPAGYVTVTFAKGEHGKLEGETSQHVNPTKVTDLKALAPKVKADVGFKHTGWDKALKAKFDKDTTVTATYEALPDVIPGSQEKPEGYVTVTFAKGEHGKLEGETSQHVNPTKITDLKTLAPKVTADTGFKHTGWNSELKKKFTEDTTITATYEALPDTVPGSQEKPAGYITVTFAKGEYGSLSGELSQHVNPTKVVDLKALAPKVKADIGFKHTGWDKELKAKFDKDTTITATYEALPDVIPGSQDKPEGYVTVTFAKGEYGSLSGELSQHVNPTKVVDLKALAPKVKANVGFKHTGWNSELKKKFTEDITITATYEALPDTVPGSQEKPAGYVTVTFAKGEHGSLSGEISQHVNPTKITDLKTLAPKVKADIGFKHTGWNSELKKKFTEDTTITATYEALPDTVPGSQEKPAGYVTVTFAKGEHGSLSGELSQHVNPTKVTDLKTLAPKVIADTGFKHTGWDKALKAKFDKDTTLTATYEAVTQKFAITIDPDGGSWNGSTDPIVYNIEKGEYITLPDAPTKEGYTFKYWKGSKYMPGDKYKVEGEHKFTAVWEKKATSKTDDSSTGKAGTSGTAGANGANANKTSTSNHAPFTADSQNVMLYLMMSIFSFVLMLKLRSQEN